MKKVILIWLALSIAYILLFGAAFDFERYIERLNTYLPNWKDLFLDIQNSLRDLQAFNWQAVEVNSLESFFQAFGNFFTGVGMFFKFLYQILLGLPIKLIIFIVQTIIAVMPITAATDIPSLEVISNA